MTYLIWILVTLLIVATLLPLSKIPFGVVRGLEFPRQQYFVVSIALAVCAAFLMPSPASSWVLILALLVAAAQLIYVAKFTPLWPVQSVSVDPGIASDRQLRVLAANVKKSNRSYERLIALTLDQQPDVLVAIEVDGPWIDALKRGLGASYPNLIEVPKDNGYGMCVLSKVPLSHVEVRDLVTKDVPSIRAEVLLADGAKVALYVVHPEPPVIDHDTKGRDSEIVLVGLEAAKDPLPAIMTGDLNDVAWSTTTRRFQRISGLLDPRVGRGFYNTFSATMPWMRWPLDHLFHDARFRLVEMRRLPKIGSDHFPMWFVLVLAETEAKDVSPGAADPQEAMEAKRMIVKERHREREPIGGDWEDD